MAKPVYSLVSMWGRRWARPDPLAVTEAERLLPAVVITGGSRGIGAAIARRFATERSHAVLLVARDRVALEETAGGIARDSGCAVHTLSLDVTRMDAPLVIDAALAEHGLYLDCLVSNAGVGLAGPLTSQTEGELEALIALNVTAVTRLMRHYLPTLKARGRGAVLNIASLGGFVPGPHQAAYYASKAFVISITEAVAHEMRGEGVRIAVIAPGPVDTRFHETMGAERSLYRWVVPSRSPDMVARAAFRGLMLGRTVIVPGVFETLSSALLRIVPRSLSVHILGLLLTKRGGPHER
jgi:uncharacterized protein